MGEFNMIVDPVRAFLVQIGSYLPRVAVALALVIAGWLVAKAVRFTVCARCARSTSTC
jgi:hypothetical protein